MTDRQLEIRREFFVSLIKNGIIYPEVKRDLRDATNTGGLWLLGFLFGVLFIEVAIIIMAIIGLR